MRGLHVLGDGLLQALLMVWQTLWALVLGFTISGAVQAFVTRGQMEHALGRRGVATLARATALGAASSSCSYAAAAMAKSLVAKGADLTAALVFMIASTNLVVELGIVLALLIGWQFTASEFAGGLLAIALVALVARVAFPAAMVRAARARLSTTRDHQHHGDDVADDSPRSPWTLAGWADAAGYAIGDIRMLRRELLIGFAVAGLLAAAVPDVVWSHVFVSGNGFWSSLENVVVGPLIAVISFVCSIGNVPLAAALWKGGISFGGVVSFLLADLITLPLLLIYRRYYGGALTLRILAVFWLAMSAAGLAVEYVFRALGAVPSVRPERIAAAGFALDATTALDILALAVLAILYTLHHNGARLGAGGRTAVDPVCGMQVERSRAPARRESAGRVVYFCSDRCAERYPARAADAVPAAARR